MTETVERAQRTDIPAEDGMYGGISDELYHSDRGSLSASGAKLLLPPSCPAEFQEAMDNPKPPTKAYDFGHLAHRMVLGEGSELFVMDPKVHGLKKDNTVAENPANTTMWKDAAADARARGEVPVHVDQYETAKAMEQMVRAHRTAGPLFRRGHAEKSLYATDPTTGVRLRVRPDWLTLFDFDDGQGERNVVIDYKTVQSVDPHYLKQEFWKFRYVVQAAFYLYVISLQGHWPNPVFLFAAQKKTPKHLVRVVEYPADAMAVGARLVRQAIDTYARCRDANHWPDDTEGITPISLPDYAFDGGQPTIYDLITDED